MAHEFDSGMFLGKKAWHGLGTVVDKAQNAADAIKTAGMDWMVQERMIIDYATGSQPLLAEGWKSLRRSDNDFLLHICRESWTPVQNVDAFGFFDSFIQDGDATLDACISLDEGRRIAITAKINSSISEVVKGDPVEQYLILFNSHDGSLSLGVMFSNIRVVCSNTLGWAIRDQKAQGNYKAFKGKDYALTNKMIRLKHTASIHENLAIVRDGVDLGKRQFALTMDSYRAMADKKLNSELYKAYLTKIFHSELKVGTEEERKITDFKHYEQLERNFDQGIGIKDIKGVHGTAWAAYQSVTQWVTHERGGDDIESARNRLNQQWFGNGAKIIEKAHTEALALA